MQALRLDFKQIKIKTQTPQTGCVVHTCHPRALGIEAEDCKVEPSLGKVATEVFFQVKRGWGCNSM